MSYSGMDAESGIQDTLQNRKYHAASLHAHTELHISADFESCQIKYGCIWNVVKMAGYLIVSSAWRGKYAHSQNSYWKCHMGYDKIKENFGECV